MSDVAQPFLEKGQLSDFSAQLERCARCSYCKFVPLPQIKSQRFSPVCPSIQKYNFHAYSAGGRIAIGLGLATDRISYTDKLLDVVYRCTLCGACDISCKAIMGGMLEWGHHFGAAWQTVPDMLIEPLDEMYHEVLRTKERAKRFEIYKKANEYMADQALYVFTMAPLTLYGVNEELEFVPHVSQYLYLDYSSVTENHWSITGQSE